MADEESIKVAVRLRPFLETIKDEADGRAKRIIRMDELSSTVGISNPDNPGDIHKFTFDNVLWSFDGYSEQPDGYLAPENRAVSEEIYCDQKQVYDGIGKEIIQNLWNGYSSTVFTFGESKSGKSWTLLGLGPNKGVLPQTLTDLFKGVREKEKVFQQSGFSAEVRFTMAEIYNNRVKDLLPPTVGSSTKFKNVVKIREHSKKGFYVEGLRSVIIVNHEDIQHRLEEGLMNRAVFLTNINATASNSMSIITITLVQKSRNHRGDEVTRTATLEFLDLPACDVLSSESDSDESMDFISSTNNTLKANGIDTLSFCVDKLLEESIGKHSGTVPFHHHAVSKLLKSALTGNSRTYMIVTLSPSETSYKNSIVALQFAEKVRMLSTRSAISEEVTSKLIRELKGESDRLKKLITLGEFDQSNYFTTQVGDQALGPLEREAFKRRIVEDMKAQIKENEKEVRNLQQPYEERLKTFKAEKNDLGKKQENDRRNKCHIFNLNADSQISGKIIHILPLGTIDFGQVNKGKENHFLVLCGPGIRELHGTFTYNSKDGKISIKPAGANCKILVNESLVQFDTVLTNNDRIVFGGNQIWVYQNPKETWLEKYAFSYKLHYEYVSEELALKSECYKSLSQAGSLSDEVQKELIYLIPAIQDATTISEELGQNFTLKPLILQPIDMLLRESSSGDDSEKSSYYESFKSVKSSEVLIKVRNTVDGTFYYWTTCKFNERLEMLKDSYMQFLEDNEMPLKEVEAFTERIDVDMPIGYTILALKPLAYLVNISTTVPILDYITFQQIGNVHLSLNICDDESGEKLNDVEVFIESPDELIDDNLTVVLSIQNPEKISLHYKEVYCKYKFLDDEITSSKLDPKQPNFIGFSNKYEKTFSIKMITQNTLNTLLTQFLILRFYGKQKAHKLLNLMGIATNSTYDPGCSTNPFEQERINAQLKLKEKVEQRHQRRLNAMKALVDQSETLGEESIPVTVVKRLFQAKSQKQVDQSLEEHKESLTVVPEEEIVAEKQLAPELKALKRFSEICSIS